MIPLSSILEHISSPWLIQRWYYLFDQHNRWGIQADSLRYCMEHKELELNGYVFMLNHLHLIPYFARSRLRIPSGWFYADSGVALDKNQRAITAQP